MEWILDILESRPNYFQNMFYSLNKANQGVIEKVPQDIEN